MHKTQRLLTHEIVELPAQNDLLKSGMDGKLRKRTGSFREVFNGEQIGSLRKQVHSWLVLKLTHINVGRLSCAN
jgi:hypothetical protein